MECARHGCGNMVKEYRSKYCSPSCFAMVSSGTRKGRRYPKAKPSQRVGLAPAQKAHPYRNYQRPNGQTAIVKPPAHQAESWWTDPHLPREGLTALASQRAFSQDRKAMVLPVWINE